MRVDLPRHQFLAGAAFTRNQRCCVRNGKLSDQLENVLHLVATPHDAEVVILRLQQGLVGDDLLHRPRGCERVGDDLLQLRHVEGFQQIIVRAQLHASIAVWVVP